MSSAGRAVSSTGCVTKPKGRETGLRRCFVQIRSSLLTGSYVMETAEQQEPYESRGSRTVLGEPGGESPPGHSTIASYRASTRHVGSTPTTGPAGWPRRRVLRARTGRPHCKKISDAHFHNRTSAPQQIAASIRTLAGVRGRPSSVSPSHPPPQAVRASGLTIPGVNSSVRTGPRSEVTTSTTSTVLKISSATNRSPAALRVS